MKKVILHLEESTFEKIKYNALMEKRSITNYLQVILTCMFENGKISENIKLIKEVIHSSLLIEENSGKNNDINMKYYEQYNDNNDIYNNENYDKLEQLGIKLKEKEGRKTAEFEDDSGDMSDHKRAWLYLNPTKTSKDYRKLFSNEF